LLKDLIIKLILFEFAKQEMSEYKYQMSETIIERTRRFKIVVLGNRRVGKTSLINELSGK
jgi:GTPase SAR1 family protein